MWLGVYFWEIEGILCVDRHLSAVTYQAPQVQHSEFVFLCYKAQVPNEIQFAQNINFRKNNEFFFDEKRFSAI